MKPGGSNSKGAAFERHVCKQLSKWISGGSRDDVFWRTAMSGGRATLSLRKGSKAEAQSGDVAAIHSSGEAFLQKFFVECKHRKDLHLQDLIYQKNGEIIRALIKATQEAADYNKWLFLIAKQNFQKEILFIPCGALDDVFPELIENTLPVKALIYIPWLDLAVYDFEKFLANVSFNK